MNTLRSIRRQLLFRKIKSHSINKTPSAEDSVDGVLCVYMTFFGVFSLKNYEEVFPQERRIY